MFKHTRILLVLFFLFFTSQTIFAATNFVSKTGGHVSPFLSWVNAATNIQNAVDIADEGNTILITNGTYVISSEIKVTNGVHVKGIGQATQTIVDGNNESRCFFIDNSNAILDCLTIMNGNSTNGLPSENGGGVYITTNGIVRNCVFYNNVSPEWGGGIYLGYGGLITNCLIRHNYAMNGGGLFSEYGNTILNSTIVSNNAFARGGIRCNGHSGSLVKGCTIIYNSTDGMGGGIGIYAGDVVENCVISHNSAVFGGGGVVARDGGIVRNCLITHNTSSSSHGGGAYIYAGPSLQNCTIVSNLAAYGGGICFTSTSTVENTILYFNECSGTGPNFYNNGPLEGQYINTCSYPMPQGINNITNEPLFVNVSTEDFHIFTNSHCVNSASNMPWMSGVTDLDGITRIFEGTADIGCYEQSRDTSIIPPVISNPVVVAYGQLGTNFNIASTEIWVTGSKTNNRLVTRQIQQGGWVTNDIYQTLGGTVWSNLINATGEGGLFGYCSSIPALHTVSTNATMLRVINTYCGLDVTSMTCTVGYHTTSRRIAGHLTGYFDGGMWVSNAANGIVLSFPAASDWKTPPVPLSTGLNEIVVFASNSYGAVENESIIIMRGFETEVALAVPKNGFRTNALSFDLEVFYGSGIRVDQRYISTNNGLSYFSHSGATTFPNDGEYFWTAYGYDTSWNPHCAVDTNSLTIISSVPECYLLSPQDNTVLTNQFAVYFNVDFGNSHLSRQLSTNSGSSWFDFNPAEPVYFSGSGVWDWEARGQNVEGWGYSVEQNQLVIETDFVGDHAVFLQKPGDGTLHMTTSPEFSIVTAGSFVYTQISTNEQPYFAVDFPTNLYVGIGKHSWHSRGFYGTPPINEVGAEATNQFEVILEGVRLLSPEAGQQVGYVYFDVFSVAVYGIQISTNGGTTWISNMSPYLMNKPGIYQWTAKGTNSNGDWIYANATNTFEIVPEPISIFCLSLLGVIFFNKRLSIKSKIKEKNFGKFKSKQFV